MNRKRIAVLTCLCLLMSLLPTACGGPSQEQIDAQAERIAAPLIATYEAGGAGPTATPSAGPTTTPTRTPPPDVDLAPSQVLRLSACCSGSDFYTIDPALAWWGDSVQVVTEAFVGLTRQNEETGEVEPGMAVDWDVSPDGRVWTFYLRTDVPWVRYNRATERVEQEELTVTASDFEYGIKRILDPETDSFHADLLYFIEGAEAFNEDEGPASDVGVQALDESTLEIRLTQRASYFDVIAGSSLMVAQPEWLIEEHGEEWTEAENFQSYGPYALKEWVHESHLTLVKNRHWPGSESVPQPTLEEITWTLLDNDVALLEYQAGDLDVVGVSQDELASVADEPEFTAELNNQPILGTYYLGFNTDKPPFDDPSVRRAFSLATDRQALVSEATEGDQVAATWFTPPELRAAPAAEEYTPLDMVYNPGEARDLLDQVYPDLSEMPPVTLTVASYDRSRITAESVQVMWEETLGIEIELELMSNFGEYLDLLEEDTPQIWLMGWVADLADAHYSLGGLFQSGSGFDHTNWSNDEFESLIDEAALTTDPGARAELYARAEEILVEEEAVLIPLYWYTQSVLTRPYVYRTYSQIGDVERFEKWALLEH